MTKIHCSPVSIGIDVGGTKINMVARDISGISGITSVPTPQDLAGFSEVILNYIRARIRNSKSPITNVGLCLPAMISNDVVAFAPNLPYLEGVNLAQIFWDKLPGAKFTFLLDGHAALIAELADGAAKGPEVAALVALGTGIGGAISIGGRIVRGKNGLCGCFGWMDAKETVADDGRHGPWEKLASGTALMSLMSYDDFGVPGGKFLISDAVLAIWVNRLARGIASIANVFDPDLIVLVGGVCKSFNRFSHELDRQMRPLLSPMIKNVQVVVGKHATDAALIGAMIASTDLDQFVQ